MDVHDEYIPEETFADCLTRLPQVCVELVVVRDGELLLALRSNDPARGEWFWPGSRLYKGEGLEDAARRVGREELGIEVELLGRLGVYSHFWEESAVDGVESRHTVNVVFRATPTAADPEIVLDDQHDDYRWVDGVTPEDHEYVRRYVADTSIFDAE